MQLRSPAATWSTCPRAAASASPSACPTSERQRLRKLIEKVDIGGGGVIVRTAAQGAKQEDFVREIAYLHRLDEVVEERAKKSEVGQMIFQEADLSIRVVRDVLVEEFEGAVIDDPKQHERRDQVPAADRAGAGRASSSTRRRRRCWRSGTSRRRSTRRSAAGWTCPRAAT